MMTTLNLLVRRAVRPPWLYALTFVGAGLLVGLLIVLPFMLARGTAQRQLGLIQNAAQQATVSAGVLGAEPNIGQIQVGQVGPAKQYAQGLVERASDFTAIDIKPAGRVWPPLLPPQLFPTRYTSAVSKAGRVSKPAETEAAARLKQVKRLYLHDAAVASALVNVLSYNAPADFASYSPGSDDTKKRLQLAETGLVKTRQALTAIDSQNDPQLAGLIAAIDRLAAARAKLAAGGAAADWIQAVSLEQTTMITNRLEYWQRQAGPLAQVQAHLAADLNALVPQWTPLAAGLLP